jgi:ribose 5-phosphate isomerase B
MRIAIGSDERTHLADVVLDYLVAQGHEVRAYGALAEAPPTTDWPVVSRAVAEAVASGQADEGIVMCWTGTGASIAANKVGGVRAALCADAETARGARVWNHANVLALSLRSTPEAVAREILDAWFATPWSEDDWNRAQVARLAEMDAPERAAPDEPGEVAGG